MEIVSSIVKDQLNRFIIEMGDSAMKKKTIIISGIAAVLVIGSVVFCFAVKGDSTQPADVAQTVTEAVATPTIEIPEEVVEQPEVVEEVEVVEVPEESVETSETEGSIVEVAETTEEDEDSGVSTQKEEVSSEQVVEPKPEEVKPAETKPAEAQPTESKPVETQPSGAQEEARKQAMALLAANGGAMNIPNGETGHVTSSSAGAGVTLEQ